MWEFLKVLFGCWFNLFIDGLFMFIGVVVMMGVVFVVCVVVVLLLGWVFGLDGFFMGGVLNMFVVWLYEGFFMFEWCFFGGEVNRGLLLLK